MLPDEYGQPRVQVGLRRVHVCSEGRVGARLDTVHGRPQPRLCLGVTANLERRGPIVAVVYRVRGCHAREVEVRVGVEPERLKRLAVHVWQEQKRRAHLEAEPPAAGGVEPDRLEPAASVFARVLLHQCGLNACLC